MTTERAQPSSSEGMSDRTEHGSVSAPRWSVWALLGTAVVVVVAGLIQFNGLTDRPPGFYLDESSYAYNAWTIAQHGVDEHGLAWPIIFEALPGDWKSAPYSYLLAVIFTTPSG